MAWQFCGAGRSRCEGPVPGTGSTLDKAEEILKLILFVGSNIELKLIYKKPNTPTEEVGMLKKN